MTDIRKALEAVLKSGETFASMKAAIPMVHGEQVPDRMPFGISTRAIMEFWNDCERAREALSALGEGAGEPHTLAALLQLPVHVVEDEESGDWLICGAARDGWEPTYLRGTSSIAKTEAEAIARAINSCASPLPATTGEVEEDILREARQEGYDEGLGEATSFNADLSFNIFHWLKERGLIDPGNEYTVDDVMQTIFQHEIEIGRSASARATAAEAALGDARKALIEHAVHMEYDYPGDVPEPCGMWCRICRDHVEDNGADGHAPTCIIARAVLRPEAPSTEAGE